MEWAKASVFSYRDTVHFSLIPASPKTSGRAERSSAPSVNCFLNLYTYLRRSPELLAAINGSIKACQPRRWVDGMALFRLEFHGASDPPDVHTWVQSHKSMPPLHVNIGYPRLTQGTDSVK